MGQNAFVSRSRTSGPGSSDSAVLTRAIWTQTGCTPDIWMLDVRTQDIWTHSFGFQMSGQYPFRSQMFLYFFGKDNVSTYALQLLNGYSIEMNLLFVDIFTSFQMARVLKKNYTKRMDEKRATLEDSINLLRFFSLSIDTQPNFS